MRRRPKTSREGGFALLVIVLIVALIGVAAVALLDIVNVDLLIVGQHRRTVDAHSVAMGAMYEVLGDQRLDGTVFPLPNTPQLSYQYAGKQGANYVRDPQGRFSTTAMNPNNSAFIKNLGTPVEEGYSADIALIRMGPPEDTGLNTARDLVYEVRVIADVGNGDATKEVRATTSRRVAMATGRQITPVHAR